MKYRRGWFPPDPWSLGLNYKPWEQIDLSAGVVGGKKFMARVSLQDQIFNWPVRPAPAHVSPDLISPRPQYEAGSGTSTLLLSPYHSTGNQIGQAARITANKSTENNETITIALKHKGLKGPTIKLIRKDLEDAILNNRGSPEEIWQDATIDTKVKDKFSVKNLFKNNKIGNRSFRFILDNKLSLAETFIKPLYRSAALIETEQEWPFGFVTGASARINIASNFSRLEKLPLPSYLGVRSDELNFTKRSVAIDRLYSSWFRNITDSTYMGLTVGYLEEMYAGFGGEILYRPFGKTFAIGVEGWKPYKRIPSSNLNKKIFSETNFTGHLNLFYEVPNQNFTTYAKIGRYLGNDFGGTIGAKNSFDNGTSLEGFITASNLAEPDIFGNKTYLHGGLKLNIPLGNIPFIPNGSAARFGIGPLALITGQTLAPPLPLYEVTEPFSSRRLNRSWKDLLN